MGVNKHERPSNFAFKHKPKQCLYLLFLTKCYITDVECLRYWATQTLDNAEHILYISSI